MKTEHYEESTEYTELAQEVIEEQPTLHWLRNGVRVCFLSSSKDKTNNTRTVLGECIRVEEIQQVFCPYDFLIVIYEPNCIGLDREQRKILLYHEMLHIGFDNTKNGVKYKIVPHDVEEFEEIIRKYGVDWT